MRALNLGSSVGVDLPAEKRSVDKQLAHAASPPLAADRVATYLSCCMRVVYLAQDRADLGTASKMLARGMKETNEGHWEMLKKVGRYLKSHPQMRRVFNETASLPDRVRCFVDTDHAGCAITRKSTTGLVTRLGPHTVRHSSNLQSTIALSSGESEFYGLVKGAAAGLGAQALLADWGLNLSVEVLSDSSAARGHVTKRGLGKMRHIQTRFLWVQERVGEGHIKITCVPGPKNYADILTKEVSGTELRRHLTSMGFEPCAAHDRHRGLL